MGLINRGLYSKILGINYISLQTKINID